MKKHLLLLLCLPLFMSCKKETRIEPIVKRVDDTSKKVSVPVSRRPADPVHVIGIAAPNDATAVTISLSDSADLLDHTVEASVLSPLYNVPLLAFNVSVKGYVPLIKSLRVHINASNSGIGSNNAYDFITVLRLYNSRGEQIAAELVPYEANPVVIFHDINLFIASGTTAGFVIKADISPIDGTRVTVGSRVRIDITDSDIAGIEAFNKDSLFLNPANLLGSSIRGSNVYFYVNGISVGNVIPTTNHYTFPSGSQTHGIFTMVIPFAVSAYGRTVYIPARTAFVTQGSVSTPLAVASPHIQYSVDNGSVLQMTGATATVTYTGDDALNVDSHGNYQIPVGQTKQFNLVVTFQPSVAGSYRAQLVNVNYNTSDSPTDYVTYTTGISTNKFRTSYSAGM